MNVPTYRLGLAETVANGDACDVLLRIEPDGFRFEVWAVAVHPGDGEDAAFDGAYSFHCYGPAWFCVLFVVFAAVEQGCVSVEVEQ